MIKPVIANINSQNSITVLNQSSQSIFSGKGTFSALVVGIDNNNFLLEILGDGTRFNTNIESKHNIGDTLEFEVISTGDLVKLKLLKQNQISSASGLRTSDVKNIFEKSGFTKEIKEGYIDSGQIDKDREIAALKRRLASGEKTLNTSIVNKMLSQGINISDIDISKIKEEKEILTPSLGISSKEISENIKIALESHNLPSNEENINNLTKVYEYFEKSNKIENVAEALKKENFTLEDLHNINYKNNIRNSDKEKLILPTNFENELKKLYKNENILITKENYNFGKILYENDIEITKENIQILSNIENINSYYILDKSAKAISDGKSVTSINLKEAYLTDIYQDYEDLFDYLPKIETIHINNILLNEKEVTLSNLKNEYELNSNLNLEIKEIPEHIDLVMRKRQLAEIRLKLTYEAAYKLIDKNIKIDTMPLELALDELRKIENEYYQNFFKETSTSKVGTLVNVFDTIQNINPLLPPVYKYISENNENFTLKNVNQVTTEQKLVMGYEPFMTVPNSKYGDTFSNVSNMLETVVSDLGFEISEENIKVASILSRSGIDINIDNFENAKLVNKKLEYVTENLHPSIAAQLIEENINPLEIHIDELIKYVEEKDMGSVKDKIAENIFYMEENLSVEQRSKIMAVYRALNQVSNYGSVSLGLNIKSGNDLTIGNLLDAAQYYKKTGNRNNYIDISTDTTLGASHENNIRQILNSDTQSYNDLLLKETAKNTTPEHLKNANDNTRLEDLSKTNKNFERAEKLIENIKEVSEKNIEALHFLEKNNVKATLPNVTSMVFLVERPKILKSKLDKIKEDLEVEKIPSSPTEYIENDKTTNEIVEVLDKLTEINPEIEYKNIDLKDIEILKNTLKLQSNLNSSSYFLPIKIDGKVTSLNMYVQNKISNNISVSINLDTEKYGNIDAYIKMSKNNIDIYIQNDEDKINFKHTKMQMIDSFAKEEFNINTVIYNGENDDNYFNEMDFENYNSISNLTKNNIFKMATCFTNYLNELN
ncbi:MAG: DUF6240 domain-containing protein [Defluviitaleaceae bacterium]|nr:DUF6240 domain-containing protein [Defluviitaleaceae bacterium]